MTYNSRPLHGIKESFFGPAAYAEAQFQQSINPQPAQSLAIGDSVTKPSIEGYEKTIWPKNGVKTELMGAAAVSQAQAEQTWEETNHYGYTVVTFTSTTTYAPAYEANKYYTKEDDVYTKLTSETAPSNWGTGEFYTSDEALDDPTYTKVTFTATTTYSPEFATDTYYKKEGTKFVLLSSQPDNWGAENTFYTKNEEE